ncbi:MAG: HD domain-containing protein [Oligoflexia bacterium]|nr:HD domain-containing protein [Oligoflexia bacterium]
MAVKILIINHALYLAKELASFLTKVGYETDTCVTGKDAQIMMYNKKYFAIVLDLAVQDHPGPQVLKFVRQIHTSVKVILTIPAEQNLQDYNLEKNLLEKQGVFDVFIGTPSFKDLQIAIEGHRDFGDIIKNESGVGVSEETEANLHDERFVQISIDEFISVRAVQFDVFVKLLSGKYIKILHSGDTFDKERVEKYKNEKKVEHLYFLKEDRTKFVRLQNFVAEKAIVNKKVSAKSKVNLVKGLSEIYIDAVYEEGLKPLIIEQGKAICDNIYDIVHKKNDLHKLLREYSSFSNSLSTHSYLVTFFASMIIRQFEWDSKTTNETLGMAALLHDIGCTKLAEDIREMSPFKMNEEQLNRYKLHCQDGVDILNACPSISQMVKQIVLQHHERINGEGFPCGLKYERILELAQVVGLADEFVRHMVDNQIRPPDALKKMLLDQNCLKRYNGFIIERFLKVFTDPDGQLNRSLNIKV